LVLEWSDRHELPLAPIVFSELSPKRFPEFSTGDLAVDLSDADESPLE